MGARGKDYSAPHVQWAPVLLAEPKDRKSARRGDVTGARSRTKKAPSTATQTNLQNLKQQQAFS